MPLFPTFRRPCPNQADLSAVMDGDWCRMCGQQVHDITDLSDVEREALLRSCRGEICVSYRVPVTLAAAALAASAAPAAAVTKPKHHPHAHQVTPPEPPLMTLAGAPLPMPPEPAPPSDGTTSAPTPTPTPLAGPRSSP